MMPEPALDQLQISIWKGLNQQDTTLSTFEKSLGKPKLTKDGKMFWWAKHRIRLRRWEKWAYQLIRFSAKQPTLSTLNQILPSFPCKPDGKNAAQLRSVEIAWDFPIGNNYDEAEVELRKLAAIAMLKNRMAKLYSKESKCNYLDHWFDCFKCQFFNKCQRCRDGASNGGITFYFHSLGEYFIEDEFEDDDGYLVRKPKKNATFWGKIYCKRLAPKKPWCIRFEVTLLGQKLEKTIGKALPADLTTLPTRLASLRFDDFWYFEQFDWPAFMEAAKRSAKYKNIPFVNVLKKAKGLQASSKVGGLEMTMWQRQVAKKIAGFLKSKSLATKIGAKEFSKILKCEDVLLLKAISK